MIKVCFDAAGSKQVMSAFKVTSYYTRPGSAGGCRERINECEADADDWRRATYCQEFKVGGLCVDFALGNLAGKEGAATTRQRL